MNKVTIRDVAREAGVSAQTVARVLNSKGEVSPETRQKVKEVIRRLGYRPRAEEPGALDDIAGQFVTWDILQEKRRFHGAYSATAAGSGPLLQRDARIV